jgi:hypothetical protein
MAAPEPQNELSQGAFEATSRLGLARGHLSVLGTFTTGTTDFELVLSSPTTGKSAVLDSFEAIMPAHGHRATPSRIEGADGSYEILELPLAMPGVWRLAGTLQIEAATDEIWFDVEVP